MIGNRVGRNGFSCDWAHGKLASDLLIDERQRRGLTTALTWEADLTLP